MKLTYWYSQCPGDSDAYSVREPTRKAALAILQNEDHDDRWPAPRKVTIEYDNAFDLMVECSREGHHWWEAR